MFGPGMAIFGPIVILRPCLTSLVHIVWPNFTLVGHKISGQKFQVKAYNKGGGGDDFCMITMYIFGQWKASLVNNVWSGFTTKKHIFMTWGMAIFGPIVILRPCLTSLVHIVWPNFTLVGHKISGQKFQVKAYNKGGGGMIFA
jgi:hypothetical protein